MPDLRMLRTRAVIQRGVVLTVAAILLASCGSPQDGTASAHSNRTITPNASVDPSSLCPSSDGFVQQSFNGDITGCFRIPALNSSSLVVALQTYLINSAQVSGAPTTTISPPIPKGDISLSLRPRTATPGETVSVTGRYMSKPPAQKTTLANLCWDGCRTGLQESVQLHWSSPRTFHTKLVVPDTAWLVSSTSGVSVHPLQSGSYEVGIQCLGSISGCDYTPAEARTTIQLNAPKSARCGRGQRCETLRLSAPATSVGDEVKVTGWAPLQSIIGQPSGYDLSVAQANKDLTYKSLSYNRTQKSGGYEVVLAPKILRVLASKTWANLGRVRLLSSTWAGPSAVNPESNANLIAWCQTTGLDITGGPTEITVPTVGARAALAGTVLKIFSSPSADPQCATVLLDQRYPATVYAGFNTASGLGAPPVYIAGLYTTDSGAVWRTVPTPPGTSLEDFAGFRTEGRSVLALFAGLNSYFSNRRRAPPGTSNGLVRAEVTANGGASWAPTMLGCPSTGPCATFGPYQWGNCAMNGSMQPLLLGPSNVTALSGVKWTTSSWVTTVNSCFSQQLAVTSNQDLLLLDPSSQYSLLRSTNSGTTWSYYALPLIPGMNYGPDNAPMDNSLVLAPDGSIFASVTTPSGQRQELFRLGAAATSWCQVPRIFASPRSSTSSSTVGSLRVNRSDLIWSESNYPNNATSSSSMHDVPLSRLHC